MIGQPRAIVGLDLSLTATGVARIVPNGDVELDTIRSAGRRGASLTDRARRLRELTDRIAEWIDDDTDVCLEGPSYGSSGAGTWDRAGLWWRVVGRLTDRVVPVAIVAPTTRAKWATGSGRAGKRDVIAGVLELYPDAGRLNDNEADALTLAHQYAHRIGWPVPTTPHQTPDAHAAVQWPYELDDREQAAA